MCPLDYAKWATHYGLHQYKFNCTGMQDSSWARCPQMEGYWKKMIFSILLFGLEALGIITSSLDHVNVGLVASPSLHELPLRDWKNVTYATDLTSTWHYQSNSSHWRIYTSHNKLFICNSPVIAPTICTDKSVTVLYARTVVITVLVIKVCDWRCPFIYKMWRGMRWIWT
jgi:hypothetical protein